MDERQHEYLKVLQEEEMAEVPRIARSHTCELVAEGEVPSVRSGHHRSSISAASRGLPRSWRGRGVRAYERGYDYVFVLVMVETSQDYFGLCRRNGLSM